MKSCLNRKNFFVVSFCVVVVCVFGSVAFGQPWTGGGTVDNPYQIWDVNDMQAIGADANYWEAHFKLMDNIDLAGLGGVRFNVIGNYVNPFSGSFDGDGHVVSGFVHDGNGLSHVGLFADIDGVDARVKGLGLIDVNIIALGNWHAGALVGRVDEGTVTACYVSGKIVGNTYVGSLVGFNKGNVSECYGTGEVSGMVGVGGVVGHSAFGSQVSTSYFNGVVSGEENIGGLVGSTYGVVRITNCYSAGSVLGGRLVGGLVGWHGQGSVAMSYSSAAVSGDESVGGLIGDNGMLGFTYLSFWDTEASGQVESAGGLGRSTSEMQRASTFLGWGCEAVWRIEDGIDYPHLLWENTAGQPIDTRLTDLLRGGGDANDPYQIFTTRELNTIGLFNCEWDKHFKLMADIELDGLGEDGYNIIGTDLYQPFRGFFDGSGHTVSKFMYSGGKEERIGLFGCVDDPNAEIMNLVVIEPNIQAETAEYVGALIGELRSGTISRCWVEGGSVKGWDLVGGLVGSTRIFGGPPPTWADIRECYCNVHVSGLSTATYTGGLIGWNAYCGKVHECHSAGDVEGNKYVGGLVGRNDGNIEDCYAQGGVSGQESVGGLVGTNVIANISRCYSTGEVTGGEHVGGLVGKNIGPWGGTIMNSFWDVNTSGMSTSDGGTAKTTAEMKTKSTFTTAGWDFNTPIWKFCSVPNYPSLWWEEGPVLEPVELIAELLEEVAGLRLPSGIENGLEAKLNAALQALEDENENNDIAAINTLGAFISAVEAQRGKKIPEAEADALIAAAMEVIELLSDG